MIKHNVYRGFLVDTLSRICQTTDLELYTQVIRLHNPLKSKEELRDLYLDRGEFPPYDPSSRGLELH